MATVKHSVFCFEALAAKLEDRKGLGLEDSRGDVDTKPHMPDPMPSFMYRSAMLEPIDVVG